MRSIKAITSVAALLLAACSSIGPLQQDQPVILRPDEGLAAVVISTRDPLWAVTLQTAGSNGTALEIQSVPTGRNLYLFRVQAGYYCFRSFMYGGIVFKGHGASMTCFRVPAGQLGYSGDLIPAVANGGVFIEQKYNFESFHNLFRQQYPTIAAEFLPAQATMRPVLPPEISQQTSTPQTASLEHVSCNTQRRTCAWIEPQPEDGSQAIFIKNNTAQVMTITLFQLFKCYNVKEACEKIPFNLKLTPYAAEKVFVVKPANPHLLYYYQVHWDYRVGGVNGSGYYLG